MVLISAVNSTSCLSQSMMQLMLPSRTTQQKPSILRKTHGPEESTKTCFGLKTTIKKDVHTSTTSALLMQQNARLKEPEILTVTAQKLVGAVLPFFLLTISSAGMHRTKPTTKKDVYITMHSELRLPIKRPTEMHANYYPTHEVWLPTEQCTSNLSHTRTLKVEGLSHMSTTVQRASWRFATPFTQKEYLPLLSNHNAS